MTDFWNKMDLAVSALSAEAGGEASNGLMSWALVRPFGEKSYQVRLRHKNQIVPFPPAEDHPVSRWLKSQGLMPSHLLGAAAQEAVEEKIEEGTWDPVLDTENGWVRGPWRRPSGLMWRNDDDLAQSYWRMVVDGRGMPEHAWARELKQDLSSPMVPASRRRVLGHLARLVSYFPDWEDQSGFSLRQWSAGDEKWQDVLDQAGIGYQAKASGVPLVAMALGPVKHTDGWKRILSRMLDSHLVEAVLQPEDRPSHWWNEDILGPAPMAPLWCWAARQADAATVEMLIKARPDLAKVQDSQGRNALHWAAAAGSAEVVDVLLKHGVDPSHEERSGIIPEQLVPIHKDDLYEKIAAARMSRPRPAV